MSADIRLAGLTRDVVSPQALSATTFHHGVFTPYSLRSSSSPGQPTKLHHCPLPHKKITTQIDGPAMKSIFYSLVAVK